MAKHFKSKAKASERPWKLLLQGGVIALMTLAIYWPVLWGGWLWDDDIDITGNGVIHSPRGLWTIWFEPGQLVDFYPIKASVQWVEWQLWGKETLGYHVVNVALHIVGACLVWWLLRKFKLRFAWLGGLLFAVHPVQVESVAWIAELKNVLSLPPFLLAMGAWMDFESRGKQRDYWRALVLFLVAMLCKTTMVMFPVIILLYAGWQRGRIGWSDWRASGPFFVTSLLMGLITLGLQGARALTPGEIELCGPLSRIACAGVSLSFYLLHAILPLHLAPVYPLWSIMPPTLVQLLPWVVCAGVGYLGWMKRRTWGRHLLLGFGFFVVMLMPFLGFTAISFMRFSWVMDHFLYLPVIGLIGLVVAGMDEIPARWRPGGIGVVAAVIVFFAWGSFAYAEEWVDSKTLWSYTIERFPNSWTAHNNLGFAYQNERDWEMALPEFKKAAELRPHYAQAWLNLGSTLEAEGRPTEAAVQFEEVLKLDPRNVVALNDLGLMASSRREFELALDYYNRALQAAPHDAEVHNNMGLVFAQQNRLEEAISQFNEGLESEPDNVPIRDNLAMALMLMKRLPEAKAQFEQVLKVDPGNAEALEGLQRLSGVSDAEPVSK